jgi:hypothetical protein
VVKRALLLVLVLAGCRNFDDALNQCRDAGGCVDPVGGNGGGTGGAGGGMSGTPSLVISGNNPTTIGPIASNDTKSTSFTITNPTGGQTGKLSLTLTADAGFTLENDRCTNVQLSTDNCSFDVVFTPSDFEGTEGATVTAQADPGGMATTTILGVSEGVQLELTPPSSPFSAIVGFPADQAVTVKNTGRRMTNNPPVLDAGNVNFFVTQQCSSSLGYMGTCSATVRFIANSIGHYDGGVTATADNAAAFAPLEADALPQGQIAPSPPMLDFGDLDTGLTSTKMVVLKNTGPTTTTPLSMNSLPAGYNVDFSGCGGLSLAPDGGCTFSVTFEPNNSMPYTSQLRIDADAGGPAVVSLSGQGIGEEPLTVTLNGNGTVFEQLSDGGARDAGSFTCTGSCLHPLRYLSVADLTATGAAGNHFVGWSSDCMGDGGCHLYMNGPHFVTASFAADVFTLSVSMTGTGSGRVVSQPAGIDCGTSCSAQFTTGTQVKLYALPFRSAVTGFDAGCAPSGPSTCTTMVTSNAAVAVGFTPVNVAFVTSAGWTVAVTGGASGHDTQCQLAAADAGLGLGAGNPGTWKAWLSSSTASASSRVGSFGWVTVDGRLITTGSLTSAPLKSTLDMDEHGVVSSGPGNTSVIMTGTLSTGLVASGDTCSDWVSSSGMAIELGNMHAIDAAWTQGNFSSSGCGLMGSGNSYQMYCFEQNRTSAPTVVEVPPGSRYAFVSASTMNGAVPNTSADVICTNEARDAGFSGNFLVMRSDPNTAAADRFNPGVWYRPDGLQLFAGPNDYRTFTLVTPLNLDAKGNLLSGVGLWTGSKFPSQASPMGSTDACMAWTSTTAGSGWVDSVFTTARDWSQALNLQSCTNTEHVYCFQQ